jgi:hypothetical protein
MESNLVEDLAAVFNGCIQDNERDPHDTWIGTSQLSLDCIGKLQSPK